ncbi:MAG: hypothetical protein SGI77_17350 [Pirellulaceae bacterium]|nr:hypothetical protein [Pirellulaceae bacterium]
MAVLRPPILEDIEARLAHSESLPAVTLACLFEVRSVGMLVVVALRAKKEARDDGHGCHRLTGHDGTMPVGMRRQEAEAWSPSAASRGQ